MKNQLFEEITKEYSLQILKWAYKKCGDSDRAEELTQEVMMQIFSAVQKSTAEGKHIEQVEHFVWKIARYVWCHSLRKNTRYVMCPLEEDFDLEWLVDREFMVCENGKYATTFYIRSETEKQECYKVYGKLREQVSDVIVKGLLEAEEKIRAVGFHGSDFPMEKLLWVLIYTFCGYY